MDLFTTIDAAKDGLAWICLCVLSLIAAAYVLAGLRGAWRTLRAKLLPQVYSLGFLNPDVEYFG